MSDSGFGDGPSVDLAGSERAPVAGAHRIGPAPAGDTVRVTLVLRRRAPLPDPADRGERPLDRAELADRYGADPVDLARLEHFAVARGLTVADADAAARTMVVEGTVTQVEAAFGVELAHYQAGELAYRGRVGAVRLPGDVADAVVAVLGLDDRPQAHCRAKRGAAIDPSHLPDPTDDPWTRRFSASPPTSLVPERAAAPMPLWAAQVAELYQFPFGYDGQGETIAIIELGGGYTAADLRAYFTKAKIAAPQVEAVSVGSGANAPTGDPSGPDGEVLLDIEVAGSVAPGARLVVFFADPSDAGFLQAVTTAVHGSAYAPSVISISWGAPESQWTPQAMHAFDAAFADAGALGITVLAAAGDHGAGDGAGDGKVHADFPASSPNVIGCGGTTLTATDGHTVSEKAWNDGDGWATGGGISTVFPVPGWQAAMHPAVAHDAGPSGRGVPDVAGNADITSGYLTLTDGQWAPAGGTSAVAPLYAGLLARCHQALGHSLGAANPLLYAAQAKPGSGAFRDITTGNNSVPGTADFGPAVTGYHATKGWDACTGLGSVHGEELLKLL